MKKLMTEEQKKDEIKYERYKKLIRSLRRGKVEKISSKQAGGNITKK